MEPKSDFFDSLNLKREYFLNQQNKKYCFLLHSWSPWQDDFENKMQTKECFHCSAVKKRHLDVW